LQSEATEQTIQKLESELAVRDTEIAALKEELQDLRDLALAVRKHFNNNMAVERCAACSKCDYAELEKAMLQCKAFTRIRL
jgi:predicted RNase H-like nuclease (RuvC/YqgF family)